MNAPSDDLQRFVIAQDAVYAQVKGELQSGRKASHWMWFIFPQLRGLGVSSMATFYGLGSASEALGYWRHPTLGARLRECTELVLAVEGKSAHEIFGSPDDVKLRSCMTLFAAVATDEPIFGQVLKRFYNGQPDDRTLKLLSPR